MKLITDVDFGTMEHLLKYLKFLDLFQLAFANEHLRVACYFEFKRRYAKKLFVLSFIDIIPEYCDEGEDQVTVYSLKFILPFLRIFGSLLKSVKLSFVDNRTIEVLHAIKYLCFYCHGSIKKITMQNVCTEVFGSFDYIFPNVDEVTIISSDVNKRIQRVPLLFPKIQTINFNGWNTIRGHQDFLHDSDLLHFIKQSGIVCTFD